MADFGGEMRFNVDGIATPVVMRGEFDLDPSNVTVAKVTNLNNTNSRQFKPSAYGAALKSLEDSIGLDWTAIMRMPKQKMTIIEELTGVVHVFGNAFFEGEPSVDRSTGDVTGLRIAADTYRKANA
jgi:hypothetical protein